MTDRFTQYTTFSQRLIARGKLLDRLADPTTGPLQRKKDAAMIEVQILDLLDRIATSLETIASSPRFDNQMSPLPTAHKNPVQPHKRD